MSAGTKPNGLNFSLGGQLVAFIGQELNGVLPRITGLDPAGMQFYSTD